MGEVDDEQLHRSVSGEDKPKGGQNIVIKQ